MQRHATSKPVRVLDLGGRNVNGSPRPLFPQATWTALDILPGEGVDIVADAATWQPGGRRWDVVLCLETLEHTPVWREILRTAWRALRPGGWLIVTTAAPGRPLHSGVDGGPILHAGEHYGNIDPLALRLVLVGAGFEQVTVDVQDDPADVRAVATKPG